jgi:hypothetical protein
MKLYKYRSLANLEHTLDILLNEKLHCAPYDKLNDPFEGLFLSVAHWGGMSGIVAGSRLPGRGYGYIPTVKSPKSLSELPIPGSTRVCSLSASLSDVRLWSYYADGHRGIAIEIDFEGMAIQPHKVEYVNQLKEINNALSAGTKSTEILRIKTNHWAYEKEFRIISEEESIATQGRISGVYFGLRTPEHFQTLLLRSIPKKIPVYSTKLNTNSIEIEPDRILN